MLNDEFPHNVTFQSLSKNPDGGGGYDEAWTDALNFNGFLDTPSSREIFVAQQLQNPLDRNFYYPYRTDVLEKMRCVYKYDDITETYEVIGKPQDQGGQREVMVVPLKLVRNG